MAFRRTASLFMAVLSVLFVISGIPAVSSAESIDASSDEPLSLAGPVADRLYFLPRYDEVSNLIPTKRLYIVPTVFSADVPQETAFFCDVCEVCKPVSELCRNESITPRAP